MGHAVEKAYRLIRQGIVSGKYPSGTHLKAEVLAAASGLSRTPVREAMRRLHAEGLIDFIPNRGAFVIRWEQRDIDEILDLRMMLESYGAELAARNITPEQMAELQALADRMESLASDTQFDSLTISIVNRQFHKLIASASGNRRLEAILSSIIEMSLVSRTFSRYDRTELMRSMHHHRELIAALRAGDGAWARTVWAAHFMNARHALAKPLQSEIADLDRLIEKDN